MKLPLFTRSHRDIQPGGRDAPVGPVAAQAGGAARGTGPVSTSPAGTQNGQQTAHGEVTRRAVARGVVWAVPTVAVGVAAPAYAASTDVYGATVCGLFYAAGSSVNYQGLAVQLGVSSTSSTIAQGTAFRWTVTMSGYGSGAHEVPTTNYSQQGRWRLEVSPATGQTATSFTATLTVLASDVTASELNCTPRLIWNDTSSVVGGARVDIAGSATTSSPTQGQTQASSLAFTVAKRYPANVSDPGRLAHKYLSKSGTQICYPAVTFEMTAASKLTGCGDNANDTSTTYPDGTCVKLSGTTADIGKQQAVAQRC